MDAFLLSRLQFAANITFHIFFPTITISLGWMLLFFKVRFQQTGQQFWMDLYFFFTRIFALTFSLGVVTGVTMSFQFGTNWPGYMNTVGNIAGPLLAYEVLTAFFMEATFLGIMLFGFRKVPNWFHTLATFLVAFGTTISAFFIIALNSWMHTPAGHVMVEGVAHAEDWWRIIMNPSMPYRFAHTLVGSGLTTLFLMLGLLAYRRVKGDRQPAVNMGLSIGLVGAAVLGPIQGLVGDLHGTNTRDHQPAKLAAMEALWEGESGVPMLLFALPDQESRRNHWELGIPKLGSLIITRDSNGYVEGLNAFGDDHPRVAPVFWAFRTMIGTGLLMIGVAWLGTGFLLRRRAFPGWFLLLLVGLTFVGWVATIAGWYVTEIGRQPWLVQGILRAEDAVGAVPPTRVGMTLTAYLSTYAFLLIAYVGTLFHLARKEMGDVTKVSLRDVLKDSFFDGFPVGSNRGGDAT